VGTKTINLNKASYNAEVGDKTYALVLDFSNGTITAPDGAAYTVTDGECEYKDLSEKKAWGNKDRDGMELNYSLDFGKDELGNERKFATHEKMVWWRSGVKFEEFTPTYGKIED
jgi:hypothetical protein